MAKIHEIVEERARAVRESYEQMMLGMQGAWMGFTNNMTDPVNARLRLSLQLSSLLMSYGPLLRRAAGDAGLAAFTQGITDARGDLLEPPASLVDEAQASLENAAARDARGIVTLASQTLIRYTGARRRLPPSMAKMAALGELPTQGRDVFVQLDRLQRKRSSGDFIEASLRMAMFATYFHGFTEALAATGEDTFIAMHPEHAPVELSLNEGWTGWASENTHPNTRWALQRKDAP